MIEGGCRPEVSPRLVEAACRLRESLSGLRFSPPVRAVYQPLDYAWAAHELYLCKYGNSRKRVVFLGMNPGPFGMVQTGVPFGEVNLTRDWLGIITEIGKPAREHPKRPVLGFACGRSEVSGRRLWSLFKDRFGGPEKFFKGHFVANYCPLAFLLASGANLTPDKLRPAEKRRVFTACDEHLRAITEALQPEVVVGIGDFAANRAAGALTGSAIRVSRILHPSPASPLANRGWAVIATRQLEAEGVW